MTPVLEASGKLLVPPSIRKRAGIKAGDHVEFEAARGVITIRKRSGNDEYTPAQREIINRRLAEAAEDVKAGRVYGPFETIEELERSLRKVGKASVARLKSQARK